MEYVAEGVGARDWGCVSSLFIHGCYFPPRLYGVFSKIGDSDTFAYFLNLWEDCVDVAKSCTSLKVLDRERDVVGYRRVDSVNWTKWRSGVGGLSLK